MARKPRAEFQITAEDKSAATLRQAERRLQNITGNIGKFALGASAALAGLTAGISRFAGRLDGIAKAAEVAGVATDSIQELRFAFGQLAQVTDQQVDDSLRRLNRRLGLAAEGGGPAAKTFDALGIAIRTVGGDLRSTEDVLEDSIRKLGEIESPALRAAKASEIFGDDVGPKLAAALAQGSAAVDELREKLRRDGGIIGEEQIQTASRFKDQMAELSTVITAQTSNAIFSNAEAIEALADAFGLVVSKTVGTIGTATRVVQFLGEELAARIGGIAANDLPRLIGASVDARKELDRLREMQEAGNASAKGRRWIEQQIEAQKLIVAEAEKRVELARRLNEVERETQDTAQTSTTAPSAPAEAPGQTDAELKALADREEQKLRLKRRFALEFQAALEQEAAEQAAFEETQFRESLARAAGFADIAAQEAFQRDEMMYAAQMEARIRRFEDELAQELGFKDARDRAIEESEAAHQERLLEIRTREFGTFQRLAMDVLKFEQKTSREKTQFVLGQAQQLTAGLAQNSKTMFNLNKAASIAEAIMNTATGVTAALRLGPAGIPLAALIAAQGAAQVATIGSTQFGGASSGLSSAGPGTGIPSMANDFFNAPVVDPDERNRSTITLRIEADDSEIARTLMRGARVVADEEDDLLFSGRSRQSIELRS